MEQYRRLRTRADFSRVQRNGKWWAGELLVLRALRNKGERTRFGFVVSGRVGKAVVRNRVRRRLKEIARRAPIREGWDLVFIARAPIVQAPFSELQVAMHDLLRRGGLLQETAKAEGHPGNQ